MSDVNPSITFRLYDGPTTDKALWGRTVAVHLDADGLSPIGVALCVMKNSVVKDQRKSAAPYSMSGLKRGHSAADVGGFNAHDTQWPDQ